MRLYRPEWWRTLWNVNKFQISTNPSPTSAANPNTSSIVENNELGTRILPGFSLRRNRYDDSSRWRESRSTRETKGRQVSFARYRKVWLLYPLSRSCTKSSPVAGIVVEESRIQRRDVSIKFPGTIARYDRLGHAGCEMRRGHASSRVMCLLV